MAARNRSEAVVRFVEILRRTVGCVTQTPLVALPANDNVYHVVFQPGSPALLRTASGDPDLNLSVVHHCRTMSHPFVSDAYTVTSTYYAYEILDIDESEILTYHWHPAGRSYVSTPHLHLTSKVGPIPIASMGQSPGTIRLSDMHISTGRVLLEDVVRLLITEFKVAALTDRWEDILFENTERFRADRTW